MIDSVEEALQLLNATRVAFLAQARALAIRYAIEHHGAATVDDVHERMIIPQGIDGRVMGAVFMDRSLWKPAGYIKSRRAICHGRPITVFNLISYDQPSASLEA